MAKIGRFIKRHKALTILFVVLIVVAIIAVSCVSNINKALGELSASTTPDVTVLSATTLENIVTATGTLESTNIRQVTTTYTAEVESIFVQVGDTVQQGDLLAVLDSTGVDKDMEYAEEDAATAYAGDALNYNQAARSYNETKAQLDADLSDADKQIRNAKDALNDIRDLAERTALQNSNLEALRTASENATGAYEAAQAEYGEESDEAKALWRAHHDAAVAHEAAVAAYDEIYNGFAAEIAAAQSAVDAAQSAKDSLSRQYDSALNTARDSLERQSLNDSAKTYERKIDDLREQKDEMSIYAPISGKVTAVNAEVGVSAAGYAAATATGGLSSGLFEIQNMDSMQIVTTVAEYDVVQIENGLPVSITSDASSGDSWEGVVSSISPTATDANSNFEVIITVTSDPGVLTPGMSARMSIIVESVENVYAVPFDAVVTNEAGEQVVYAWVEGAAEGEENAAGHREEIVVTTGVENDYYVQILSPQLADGMMILNDPLGVNVNAAYNMFGI